MTNEQHNKYVAYAFLAHGAFQLLMLLFIGAMFFFIFSIPGSPGKPAPPPELFGFIFGLMVVVQLVFTAPSLIASYALLKRKDWARTASIVAAVLAAMSAPVGTAACVYSLWFFLGENWKEVYPERAWKSMEPGQIPAGANPRWTGQQTNEKGEVTYHRVEPPDWR